MLGSRRRVAAPTTATTHTTTRTSPRTSGGLLSRLTGPKTRTTRATRTTAAPRTRTRAAAAPAPVHHHRRRPSIGDKVSGALLKLKGSLTRRPGQKAAGTRRMRGTDGRGARTRHTTTTTRRRRRY